MALIDFTLSNARQFYSSMGNPLGVKGLSVAPTLSPHDLCEPVHECMRPLTTKQTAPPCTGMHGKTTISLLIRLNCI